MTFVIFCWRIVVIAGLDALSSAGWHCAAGRRDDADVHRREVTAPAGFPTAIPAGFIAHPTYCQTPQTIARQIVSRRASAEYTRISYGHVQYVCVKLSLTSRCPAVLRGASCYRRDGACAAIRRESPCRRRGSSRTRRRGASTVYRYGCAFPALRCRKWYSSSAPLFCRPRVPAFSRTLCPCPSRRSRCFALPAASGEVMVPPRRKGTGTAQWPAHGLTCVNGFEVASPNRLPGPGPYRLIPRAVECC